MLTLILSKTLILMLSLVKASHTRLTFTLMIKLNPNLLLTLSLIPASTQNLEKKFQPT